MKLNVNLDYTIPEGDLKPYFDALRRGEALASTCSACGHRAFPARALCSACGCHKMAWTPLPGSAQVLHRTDGAQSSFALARFAGADRSTLVALVNPESRAMTGRLSAPIGERPGLWLKLDKTP